MKTLNLALVIAIGLVFPFPGSAQNKSTNPIESNAKNNQDDSQSFVSPVITLEPSHKNEAPTTTEAHKHMEHRIRIDRPVPINSIPDGWAKALVILTGIIGIVGIFQIIFLWETVYATKKNAEAIINSERAWILSTIDFSGFPDGTVNATIIVELRNRGKTPAWVIAHGAKFVTLTATDKLPVTPQYDFVEPQGGSVAMTDTKDSFLQIVMTMNSGEYLHILAGNPMAYVYGLVRYKSVFDMDSEGPVHETRFCYEFRVVRGIQLGTFYAGGPEAYNKYT